MRFFDVWQNSFVPLLAGIPLLILVLFMCCTCVDKTITALRKSWISYKCRRRPRTPRRVRFDCESRLINGGPLSSATSSPRRFVRSGTSHHLSGLMAHSTYVQKFSGSGYKYDSVVHTDRNAAPIQVRTVLGRGSTHSSLDSTSVGSSSGGSPSQKHQPPNSFTCHVNRRSSTPSPNPSSPINPYYGSKSPFDISPTPSAGNYLEHPRRRYSTPNSPTLYYGTHNLQDGSREDEGASIYSSISYLPEVRAYLQFMENTNDESSTSRQRSHSFSGRHNSNSSFRRKARSPRRASSSRHRRPGERSPSPYALERTALVSAPDDPDMQSTYSMSPGSYGRFLTPQGSSDQGSFKSPEPGTPDWLLNSATGMGGNDDEEPPPYEDCLSNLSQSSSIRTSFI